ncbi:MAG TPA: hypothetical protein VLS45_00675 [Methylomicrobium sp.]|nr:hypothetical protein [Methylomicrobium sp.]
MCYFITVAFPKAMENSILTALPKGLQPLKFTNQTITNLLPKDYASLAIITAMCSCDLYTPAMPGEKERANEALRRKYVKKGWPENKIQRALDDHEKNMNVRREGFRDDFLHWLTTSVANTRQNLFVFVHMYSGQIETAELEVGRERIKAAEFGSYQMNFPQDVLVEIKN